MTDAENIRRGKERTQIKVANKKKKCHEVERSDEWENF